VALRPSLSGLASNGLRGAGGGGEAFLHAAVSPALESALSPLQLYTGSATFVDSRTIAFFFSGEHGWRGRGVAFLPL
jgi:hypothetical protein